MLDKYQKTGNKRVEVYHTESDVEFAQESFRRLTEALVQLSLYFNLKRPFPLIRAVLAENREAYDRLVTELLGVGIKTPSDPARVAQSLRTDLVFLSPSAYDEHSASKYVKDEFVRLIFHEMTHVFEEYLSPDIETAPFWWSEGLAAYLSGQFCIMSQFQFRQPVIEGIQSGIIPTFGEIFMSKELGCSWGWTIVGFIENKYGRRMILRLVRAGSSENIFRILGDETVIELKWKRWLLKRGIFKL